jgi:dinuclear metal center YbgI/SA1388 family protein
LLFVGLKQIGNHTSIEKIVRKCIKNDITLFSIHTNLDNHPFGVNSEIGRRLSLVNTRVLQPMEEQLNKLVVFVPQEDQEKLDAALFAAGAGSIGNYESCNFVSEGIGSFTPKEHANPSIGKIGERSSIKENSAEYIVHQTKVAKVLEAMKSAHPYEEVAYDLIQLKNKQTSFGAGLIGELAEPMEVIQFLAQVKNTFNCGMIRHTKTHVTHIKTVALCGGSGSFLRHRALASGADCYITADMKYHEFFDAEDKIMYLDIGHYESEQFTSNLLVEKLKENFTNFAVRLSELNTNPINYL